MDTARAIELLKATEAFLTKFKLDHRLDVMKTTVFYDETNCDGYCLLDDVTALLDEIESTADKFERVSEYLSKKEV